MEEGQGFSAVAFPILGEPAAAVHPGEGSLYDPSFGQHDEGFGRWCHGLIGSLDDHQLDAPADAA